MALRKSLEERTPIIKIEVYGNKTGLWINGVMVAPGITKIVFETSKNGNGEYAPKISVDGLRLDLLEKAISATASPEADIEQD